MHRKPTVQELENRFCYHAPFGDQADRYAHIRKVIGECCIQCVFRTPCSPEQTRAVNAMHEAMMLFNAAIAVNERETPPLPPREGCGEGD